MAWQIKTKLNRVVLVNAETLRHKPETAAFTKAVLSTEETLVMQVFLLKTVHSPYSHGNISVSAPCRSRTVLCSCDIVGPVEAKTTWLVFLFSPDDCCIECGKTHFQSRKSGRRAHSSQHRRCPLQNDRLHDTLGKNGNALSMP